MKKSKFLLLGVAALALSGCSFEDLMFWKKKSDDSETPKKTYEFKVDMEGGTEDEQEAILNAINKKQVCVHTKTASEIQPNSTTSILKEDDGAGVKLTTSQIVKINSKSYTVSLTWDADETQEYFGKLVDSDLTHKILEVKYKGYGVADGSVSWVLKAAECGGAKTKAGSTLTYSAVTRNQIYKYDTVHISDATEVTDEEKTVVDEGVTPNVTHKFASTFNCVDYEYHAGKKYSPYFKSNNDDNTNPEATKKYLYYNMYGKVIYLSPDGNFGLIGDGDNVMEIYQGSGEGIPLKAENFPNFNNGYVKISGNMGQYCGNIQLGFITKVEAAAQTDLEAEPTLQFHSLSEANIASLIVEGYTAQKQAVIQGGTCLSNALRSVSGTLVANSIKDKNGEEVTDVDSMANNRCTFQLQVGAQVMTVAYDYHTDKDGTHNVFNTLKAALKAAQGGAQMTIKGTMRYAGNNDASFITEGNNGVWNIVPFDASHITTQA